MNKEYCMKNRCNGCKNYGICFNYKPKNKKRSKNNRGEKTRNVFKSKSEETKKS